MKSQTCATQYDLVMGQFPSHGSAYYLKRIEKLEPGAKKNALLWSESNDLAVAYIRTAQYDKGLVILNKNLKTAPKDYHTLSNLGVLHKKQGNYTQAAKFMRQALQIKPEGHMGLGDWYLKRLEWSERYESKPTVQPDVNFLGENYAALNLKWPSRRRVDDKIKQRAQYLSKLIKNDRHFSDGYLVMGDLFWQLCDLNLAMRCYQHAQHLKHPNSKVLTQRIDAIIYHWDAKPYTPSQQVSNLTRHRARQKEIFLAELKNTGQWLHDFHAAEAKLVQEGKTPTFDQTSARTQTKRFRPKGNITSKVKLRR